jgi:hypothetical protein
MAEEDHGVCCVLQRKTSASKLVAEHTAGRWGPNNPQYGTAHADMHAAGWLTQSSKKRQQKSFPQTSLAYGLG